MQAGIGEALVDIVCAGWSLVAWFAHALVSVHFVNAVAVRAGCTGTLIQIC